jgi:hypothetical protein
VRIPLDYYRILSLPIQATAEQLQQAYRDRALQLPRREYSEAAIAARKQLLEEAYAVLSDPEQRATYDANFLAKVETPNLGSLQSDSSGNTATVADPEIDPYTPSLDIKREQFVGALLILHELGEYEQVLKLSRPYITRGSLSVSVDRGRLGDPQLVRSDIVLTIALACLELGREQWQQAQYENAATSLETGQRLLLQEGLFPSVRGEIQMDLYKLRPYRILELLALPEENVTERRQGLRLLQDMLQERGGIDGTGDDQSGLSIDDFLRFIQQLRGYLTSNEQQVLFETEAKRPSAVATYLAVYALMARGFGERQPALIAKAKQMLLRLGRRQDVHLEQAVCALLLGQTEEASRALELSQEYEPLAFIREHSQSSPDLLPGLCLYGERWLQTEVFPHFRDLAQQRVSLKDYFAEDQVQRYLEELPAEADTSSEWAAVESGRVTTSQVSNSPSVYRSEAGREPSVYGQRERNSNSGRSRQELEAQPSLSGEATGAVFSRLGSATLTATRQPAIESDLSALPPAERLSTSLDPESHSDDAASQRRRRSLRVQEQTPAPLARRSLSTETLTPVGDNEQPLLPSRVQRHSGKAKSAVKVNRLIFLAVIAFLGVAILALVGMGIQKLFNSPSPQTLPGEQPSVHLDRPPVPIPPASKPLTAPEGTLTQSTAQQLIEIWLSSKAQALGQEHQVTALEQILTEPALSTWQKRAETAKKNNAYWQYKHKVEVKSFKKSDTNPNQATAEASVDEAAQFYQAGKLNQAASYNDNLRVRYELTRKSGQWRIREMTVLR